MTAPVADYRNMFREFGETVTLKRIAANQPDQDLGTVRARIKGYRPEEIVGGIHAGSRKAILLAEGLAGHNPPVRKNDRLILADGTELTVLSVDGSTHKHGSTVLAYICEVSGGA